MDLVAEVIANTVTITMNFLLQKSGDKMAEKAQEKWPVSPVVARSEHIQSSMGTGHQPSTALLVVGVAVALGVTLGAASPRSRHTYIPLSEPDPHLQ